MEKHWYRSSHNAVTFSLLPLAWIFRSVVTLRRALYRTKIKKSFRFSVPVIVVGNITVGGTGKTPFVIWLAKLLQEQGYKPGIVSRGVGGEQRREPRWVKKDSDPKITGDEAILLARKSHCPVVIGIDRVAAVKALLAKTDCNIVISDDGLQHYRLARDIEVAIVDGARGLGNKSFLPAGPLRESQARLQEVDFVVEHVTGHHPTTSAFFTMQLQGNELVSLNNDALKIPLHFFQGQKVHAVAAIGNPQRFFTLLRHQGLEVIEHIFPDHYLYQARDLHFNDKIPIIMTEKDAVKCCNLGDERCWFLPVNMQIDERFAAAFFERFKTVLCSQ